MNKLDVTLDVNKKCSVCGVVEMKVVVLPGFYKICIECLAGVVIPVACSKIPTREEKLEKILRGLVR